MEDALYEIASVSGVGKKITAAVTEHILVSACKLVAEPMKITITAPPNERLMNSKEPLYEIAKESQIRYRQVLLRGEWWNTDSGPLLAFTESDNSPVALIPSKHPCYTLVDVANGTSAPADKDNSLTLNPIAYTFYRPFPARAIKLRDLLVMSFESVSRRDLTVIIAMALLGGLIGVINPIVMGIVIDSVIPQADQMQLLQIGLLLFSLIVGKSAYDLTRSFAMLRLEGRMDSFSQAAVWDRLISLPVSFFKDYSAGELGMRAMGIGQIRQLLSNSTLNTMISSLFSIFNGILMFKYDVRLAAVGLGLVAAAIGVSLVLGWMQIRYERRMVTVSNKISGLLLQLIGGVSKFRVSGSEHRAFYQWATHFAEQRRIRFSKELISNALSTFNTFFPIITTMTMFFIIGNLSKDRMLSTGEFIAFNATFGIFTMAMMDLSNTGLAINAIVPTYESTKPILETLPEYDESKDEPGALDGSIEIGQVTFRYVKDGPAIINNLSLTIKPGEYVAIVGASGCGKSTLIRLLLGFEKPESGKIYYSGRDLESVDIRSVRKQLGVVLQNGQLISGDILSNIVGSNPHLTAKDAEEAIAMAGMEEDIRQMPMGLYTMVSEGAGTLSGGQRQRLLIARAIVNKPNILFFDEATSALDNHTQKIVSDSLDKLNVTRIVIAHRLSTIIHCDRIIVLNKGAIAEEGTYEALIEQNGIFAELAKRQLA